MSISMFGLPRSRETKWKAKRCGCRAGHLHDSRAEARRCDELHLMQRGGVIRGLVVQPQYWFAVNGRQVLHDNGRRAGYRADFSYVEAERPDVIIVEDVKGGVVSADWPLRKALFRALNPDIILREVK